MQTRIKELQCLPEQERDKDYLNSIISEKNDIRKLEATVNELRANEGRIAKLNDEIKSLTYEIKLKTKDIEWLNKESSAKSDVINENSDIIKELLSKISKVEAYSQRDVNSETDKEGENHKRKGPIIKIGWGFISRVCKH